MVRYNTDQDLIVALAKHDATAHLVVRLNVLANLCQRFAFLPLDLSSLTSLEPPQRLVGGTGGTKAYYYDLKVNRPLAHHYNCASKTGQSKGEAMARAYRRCVISEAWVCG